MDALKDQTDQTTQQTSPQQPGAVWTDELKSRFVGYVEEWRGLMLMNGWHINVEFSESPMPDTDKEGGVDEECSASMAVNGAYLSGHHMVIYPRMLKEPDVEEQERKVIHELAHIITEAQKGLTRRLIGDKYVAWKDVCDANERATDWIANILKSLRDAGRAGVCTPSESSSQT